jgi:response regulator NasT
VKTQNKTARRLILIVDDDRLILATLSKGLHQAGYEVLQAASGEEAYRVALESKPDLAVLDVRMPNMTGIQLARLLREQTQVPFIFLSAYGDMDIARQAADYGAVGYLVKPVDTPQIIPAIEAGLARAEEIRKLRRTEAELNTALAESRETSIATGVVMERYHVSRKKAFETLRDFARSHQRRVSDVASELIHAEELLNVFDPKPEPVEFKKGTKTN